MLVVINWKNPYNATVQGNAWQMHTTNQLRKSVHLVVHHQCTCLVTAGALSSSSVNAWPTGGFSLGCIMTSHHCYMISWLWCMIDVRCSVYNFHTSNAWQLQMHTNQLRKSAHLVVHNQCTCLSSHQVHGHRVAPMHPVLAIMTSHIIKSISWLWIYDLW